MLCFLKWEVISEIIQVKNFPDILVVVLFERHIVYLFCKLEIAQVYYPVYRIAIFHTLSTSATV